MLYPLINYFGDQILFKIIRDLLYSKEPLHLRSFVNNHSLSPAGVADALRRLEQLEILNVTQNKNRKCFSLKLSLIEQNTFLNFFKIYEKNLIEKRASRFSLGASKKLKNMDEAYLFYKKVKKNRNESA